VAEFNHEKSNENLFVISKKNVHIYMGLLRPGARKSVISVGFLNPLINKNNNYFL